MNAIMEQTAAIQAQLTAPGAPFELDEIDTPSGRQTVYKQAPAHLIDVINRSRREDDACFLVYQGDRWSFGRFYAHVDALASWMYGLGIKPGDRIAIAMRNRPEWVAVFVAAARLGAVPAPLNSFGLGEELHAALDALDAKVLACDHDRLKRIGLEHIADSTHVLMVGPGDEAEAENTRINGYDKVQSRPVGPLPEINPAPEDPALILFTSGATSRAKAVVSSQRAVCQALYNIDYISAVSAMSSPEALARIQAMALTPVILTAVPLFHVSGLHAQLLTALRTGRRLVFMHKWDPKAAVELMAAEQVTQFNGAPSMVMQLLREPEFHSDAVKGRMAGLGFGGAGLPQGLIDEVLDAMPEQLVGIGYGMTESNGVGAGISGDLFRMHPTASGLQSPLMQISVLNMEGEPVAAGENGEICLRSVAMMDGYLNDDDATAAAVRDGWLHTGDLGHVDAAGFIYIVDRLKDVINRAGENIAAAEVESCLLRHPLVREAAVLGVPDEETGEAVVAVVAIQPGEELEEAELQTFVSEHLAGYKVPSMISVQQEKLPRNPAGKLLKAQIKKQLFL
ncbi:long-chain acyl-CoA synthetase [Marinobacterium halophilum]|uniref:Long-chain acyl-CoA synthetase n=1 Tax=Marinobacterium halophilum TaxID=267374 RepID=A0A2P8ERD8_9GAMM|nr:class I adenylate-forming enzyme family protein [Marinobacterium halophilum]PSL12031.1 long-chain acyl-CoA synthetase [Marinobacterium halophilum]